VEIVSEPDIRTAQQAGDWLRLLRATLKRIGVSDVNMEEGSLRCDANISIRPAGETTYGTKTELKNMNSFRFIERGIEAEVERQTEILRGGGQVEQETLHYDPATGAITSLRSKEEAHDYRYFPEPDLVPIAPTDEMLSRAREALPELPAARAERFERDLGLSADHARLLAFRGELGDFFEEALGADGQVEPATLANWVTVELVPRLGDADPQESKVEPRALARLVELVSAKTISHSAGKKVLDVLAAEGGDPERIVEEQSLGMAGADELEGIVDRALEANPQAVEELKGGKAKAIGAIVGFVMRETKGRADGGEVNRLVREKLKL
jgi:aspartyl-tRNA(Asn)/glutamyl-tRNA(Gln) amidotransferase subunit B